ncbi:MAG: hypothetical protein ACF788_02555 [Novipirellula sp. JB048]
MPSNAWLIFDRQSLESPVAGAVSRWRRIADHAPLVFWQLASLATGFSGNWLLWQLAFLAKRRRDGLNPIPELAASNSPLPIRLAAIRSS